MLHLSHRGNIPEERVPLWLPLRELVLQDTLKTKHELLKNHNIDQPPCENLTSFIGQLSLILLRISNTTHAAITVPEISDFNLAYCENLFSLHFFHAH